MPSVTSSSAGMPILAAPRFRISGRTSAMISRASGDPDAQSPRRPGRRGLLQSGGQPLKLILAFVFGSSTKVWPGAIFRGLPSPRVNWKTSLTAPLVQLPFTYLPPWA